MNAIYLSWITNHTHIHEYINTYPYKLRDVVSIGKNVFQSLCNNNLGNNPYTSNKWIKII